MRSVLTAAVLIFLIVFAAYLLVELLPSDTFGGVDRVRIVSERIGLVAGEGWRFARPLLQLIVVLLILEWLLLRAGLRVDLAGFNLTWDIRSLLALLVVVAFSLAALAGSPATDALKDVCLVVVGFYFGGLSRRRPADATPSTPISEVPSSTAEKI